MKKQPNVKQHLINRIKDFPGPYGVMLSGGVDSASVLFALLEMGEKPVVYSCTLDNYESRDFRTARKIAEEFDLKFVPVLIPTDLKVIERNIRRNIRDMGLRNKVEIEALGAFRQCIDKAKVKTIVSGLAGGYFFGLTKEANIHYKENFDEYRLKKMKLAVEPNSQANKLIRYAATKDKYFCCPWVTKAMLNEFRGHNFKHVNKPRQKESSRCAFEEYYSRVRVYGQQDMHKGDSRIADTYAQLLNIERLNPNGKYKSIVGVYNTLVREETSK